MNPILIHKGDDTIFADVTKFLTFNIDTALDLKGFKAQFTLAYIEKTIDDISSKSFDVVLTASDTAKLWLGEQKGKLILFDSVGNRKTISTTIPFLVTNDVVENQPEVISLDVPQTSGVEIELEVKGGDFVTSVNGMTGDVLLTAEDVGALPLDTEIPSISGLATEQQLNEGLLTKQDKGDYALVSDVPTLVSQLENDMDYATSSDVRQAIASIPQFKLSIVNELPEVGEQMVLYLVPKEGTNNDVYNEYIWLANGVNAYEFLGTTAVDLTDYVKNTDYATDTKAGVIKSYPDIGFLINYTGLPFGKNLSLDTYKTVNDKHFIAKGTLDNVLTQYSKTVMLTQAEYDALETKDENTLYLIEEE